MQCHQLNLCFLCFCSDFLKVHENFCCLQLVVKSTSLVNLVYKHLVKLAAQKGERKKKIQRNTTSGSCWLSEEYAGIQLGARVLNTRTRKRTYTEKLSPASPSPLYYLGHHPIEITTICVIHIRSNCKYDLSLLKNQWTQKSSPCSTCSGLGELIDPLKKKHIVQGRILRQNMGTGTKLSWRITKQ